MHCSGHQGEVWLEEVQAESAHGDAWYGNVAERSSSTGCRYKKESKGLHDWDASIPSAA